MEKKSVTVSLTSPHSLITLDSISYRPRKLIANRLLTFVDSQRLFTVFLLGFRERIVRDPGIRVEKEGLEVSEARD